MACFWQSSSPSDPSSLAPEIDWNSARGRVVDRGPDLVETETAVSDRLSGYAFDEIKRSYDPEIWIFRDSPRADTVIERSITFTFLSLDR